MNHTPKKTDSYDPYQSPPSSTRRHRGRKEGTNKIHSLTKKKSPVLSHLHESARKSPLVSCFENRVVKSCHGEISPARQGSGLKSKKLFTVQSKKPQHKIQDQTTPQKRASFQRPLFSPEQDDPQEINDLVAPFSFTERDDSKDTSCNDETQQSPKRKFQPSEFSLKMNRGALSGVCEEETSGIQLQATDSEISSSNNNSCYLLSVPSSPIKKNRQESSVHSPSEDSRFEHDYQILKTLGSGQFGSVYKCLNKLDGSVYAVKVTNQEIRGESSQKQVLREANALAALSACGEGEYIVRYHCAWIEDRQLHLVMECCQSNLADYSMPYEQYSSKYYQGINKIFSEVVKGLHYLHSANLAHLDLKPENILFNQQQNKFKIADLGLALISSKDPQITTNLFQEGDARYLAKEVLNFYQATDLKKADIFSLGIMIYHLLIAEDLPQNGEEWQMLRAGNIPKLDSIENCPKDLKSLLKQMMHPDPELRPSTQEIIDSLYMKAAFANELKWQRIQKSLLSSQIHEIEKTLLNAKKRLRTLSQS